MLYPVELRGRVAPVHPNKLQLVGVAGLVPKVASISRSLAARTSQPSVISITVKLTFSTYAPTPDLGGAEMTGQAELRRSLWQRIKGAVIQDVPEQDELCEFECPHVECTASKWRTCENRLRDLWVNSLSQPQKTTPIKQGPLFKRIAGLWPYLLIAASMVGFAYSFWASSR